MALSERGGGYSRVLCMSLLLVVWVVILGCEAAPAAFGLDGTKAREPPEEQKLTELDLMTGQGMGKSRSKRFLIPAGATISGIPISKLLEQNGTFQDGKLCISGEEPFTPDETKAFRNKALELFKVKQLNPFAEEEDAAKQNGKCVSGKCSFDPKTSSFICGKVEGGIFENGKHCFDGSDPPSYEKDAMFNDQDKINKDTNEKYGKWCKSGKCWSQLTEGNGQTFVCSSSSVQPILLLLVTLFGLCVLRNLQ